MNYSLFLCFFIYAFVSTLSQAQTQTPAQPQQQQVVIEGATIHVGNGTVISDGVLIFDDGKITYAGKKSNNLSIVSDAQRIDAAGKHVYPGLIALSTTLGLTEIDLVRATRDFDEVGDLNPHVRALIAYNTDSKITPTVRSNGVLMAQAAPQGGIISGTSSLMELDAWNWEDAVFQADDAIHLNFPDMNIYAAFTSSSRDKKKQRIADDMRRLHAFFTEAQAYCNTEKPHKKNLRFAGMCDVFSGKRHLFVRTDHAKSILAAISFCEEFGIKPIIIGGYDAHLIAPILKKKDIAVALTQVHRLPRRSSEDVNMPYKLPALLQNAGVRYCIAPRGSWQARNLAFEAGTASAWGLTKEQALAAISLNVADILGIADRCGSLEKGKVATLFISSGDALDMRTNNVEQAFINGRSIDIANKQIHLFEKYSEKYESQKKAEMKK
jgi:imidazolonepropionase-like amidohydrolase